MLLLVDNYDSFTFNIYQLVATMGCEVKVVRNDEVSVADVAELAPSRILISPGPGTPDEAGISRDLVREFGPRIPVLGVCLGHQCIGEAYGGRTVRAGELVHGKASDVSHDGSGVFFDIPTPFSAIRYHSLVIDADTLPDELVVTARTDNGLIMGVRHREYPVEGVQFHPESILSEHGAALLANFVHGGKVVA